MNKVVCLIAFLAVAFAQVNPQTGPLSVTPITPGVLVTGALEPSAQADAYHVDLYSFFVPENVSSVNITFTNTDTTSCSYINLFLSTYGIPCSDDEYSSDYQCANAWDIGGGISSYTNILTPYDDNYLFQYDVNQYWYVAIGRYSSYDYTDTCSYNFYLNFNSTCAPGSVGVAPDSSNVVCEPYTTVNTSLTYTIQNGNPAGTNDFTVFKVNVPTTTVGHIYVRVNSTSSDLDLYGRQYAGASYYTDYDCYEYSYTTVGAFYIYDMFCYTPRMGDFFITIDTNDVNWNGTATFDVLNCGVGTAGANCSFPLYPFNTSLLVAPTTLTIPYSGSGSSVSYGSLYFYWDIPANYSAGDLILYASSSQSGYLVVRRNGFPTTDSQSGYEYYSEYDSYNAVLAMNQWDYQVGGRYYFLLNCYTTPSCDVTVSLNSTSTSGGSSGNTGMVTTGTVVNGMTTGSVGPQATTGSVVVGLTTGSAQTSDNVSSPAVILVPSIAALAAAFFALF